MRDLSSVALVPAIVSLVLAGSIASAQTTAPAPEPALAAMADDPALQWGPCPEFLPAGCAIAVLHGDPARANLDVFFKVPGKASIPSHWHTSPERMVLVAGELHVTYEGQATKVLKAGSYAYGPAKRPHEGYCASAEPCILFIGFETPLDALPMAASGN